MPQPTGDADIPQPKDRSETAWKATGDVRREQKEDVHHADRKEQKSPSIQLNNPQEVAEENERQPISHGNLALRAPRSGAKVELFAVYEKLDESFKDLTLKDLCGLVQPIEKQLEGRLSMDSSLDFAAMLGGMNGKHRKKDVGAVGMAGGCDSRRPSNGRRTAPYLPSPRESLHSKTATVAPKGSRKQDQTGHASGAPHTNYCATCGRYMMFFKTRCLVCGRCYCIACVKAAMGDMHEGRKCRNCLGRRFHQRYAHRAGKGSRLMLPKFARMAEMKWAKQGRS